MAHRRLCRPRWIAVLALMALGSTSFSSMSAPAQPPAWVERTLETMTLDQKIGQLISASFFSRYTPSDSDTYTELVRLVHEYHVGGFLVFGDREPVPRVLLNATYGTVTLGQPLAAASLINRLQAIAPLPLLISADLETGLPFRLAGGTAFPRAMAVGAAGDEGLAFEAGRITAVEARAIGVHVNFAPVVDVNSNPRNPVINTRSFGEDPDRVGRMALAYARGLQAGGMLATLKHFPGHGDTDVDSHVGLPLISHSRARLTAVEWAPFSRGIAGGVDAVMTGHIELPAIDPEPGLPTTLSRPIVSGLLRAQMGFDGLVFTDSMDMQAVTAMMGPDVAAARAVAAGNDIVLNSPDPAAAFDGIHAAVGDGSIGVAQIDDSVRRVLAAKAKLGLHRRRDVNIESVPLVVGARAHAAVADEISRRALTLVADARSAVPLELSPAASILYLSVLDRSGGWGIAAPSRTLIPELSQRWPNVTAVELTDRTSEAELDLVRRLAASHDAIVAGAFVRTASRDGRMGIAPPLVELLAGLGRATAVRGQPYVLIVFGSPYLAVDVPGVPALLLTYDLSDRAERTAVAGLAGEIPIRGRLPVALPGLFPAGHGLERSPLAAAASR